MAKKSTIDYVCQSCGAVYPKWQGKCDACGEWNTIVEEKERAKNFLIFPQKNRETRLILFR